MTRTTATAVLNNEEITERILEITGRILEISKRILEISKGILEIERILGIAEEYKRLQIEY